MRPPPFQPPTQGLPRLPRERSYVSVADLCGVPAAPAAGPRTLDPNPLGLESVGLRPMDLNGSEAALGTPNVLTRSPVPCVA